MPKSMTAFGTGKAPAPDGEWVVEVSTVNSRFLDYHLRLPPALSGLEERIKKLVASRLSRGRVSLIVKASGAAQPSPRFVLNRPLLKEYQRVLEEIRQEIGLKEEPDLIHFLNNRDLILVEEQSPDHDLLWAELEPALRQAVDGIESMRISEGMALAADLGPRLQRLEDLFRQVAASSDRIVENYKQRLEERLSQILNSAEVDPQRLAYEVAILADKCDITEEAVRAQSHLDQFKNFLEQDEPVGRKLDFLTQELNREANTMGSKTPDAEAAQLVVELKAELERVREQIQNLE
ncbi:MAG: YicC/YloC family endoribonuclease [Desulfarculaceae bacterium]